MTTTSASAKTSDLQAQLVYPRAVEATIWGMPAVSMAAFRASFPRDLGAAYGDIVYFSNVATPRNEALTANNQTPYVVTLLNLKDGAMVLEIPAASDKVMFFGSAIDSWEVPLADLGPAGDDAGKGGKYLFLPPDYSGTPPQGYLVVPSPTRYVHVALRPIATAKGKLPDQVAYSQLLKTYSLANAANPPANRYIDAFPKIWKTLPTFDLNYFRMLASVIEDEPAQEKDAVMMGMLASLGIEKGKPFQPAAQTAQVLTKAVADAKAIMADYFMNHAQQPFWNNSQWLTMNLQNNYGFSFYGDGKLDYDHRAGGFTYWATWAPKRMSDPGKLPASYYLSTFRDHSGELLKGGSTYRLRVQNDVPTRDFWSVIVYDVVTNAFIYNDLDRVGISSLDKAKLQVNADGSLDVYFAPQAPAGKESNWIPTEGKDFWLLFRFYGPEKELFEKVWRLNDLEKWSV